MESKFTQLANAINALIEHVARLVPDTHPTFKVKPADLTGELDRLCLDLLENRREISYVADTLEYAKTTLSSLEKIEELYRDCVKNTSLVPGIRTMRQRSQVNLVGGESYLSMDIPEAKVIWRLLWTMAFVRAQYPLMQETPA